MMSIPPNFNPLPNGQPSSDRLALLYHLTQTFNSSLDLDEVLNRVMDEVIQATHAERGFVMLLDENDNLVFRTARGMDQSVIRDPVFQVSMTTVEGVARNGEAVITGDAQLDPRFSMRTSVRLLGLRSILCVPLKVKDRTLGTIYVDNRVQAGIFTDADLELLSAIASSAAVAIENARLYQVAVEKGRLESELQMARQVQIGLLPTETPKVDGWEFVARWTPARQVAGDFYDFIPGPEGQVGLLIADVSDKGMPAALFMSLARSILKASLDHNASPAEGMRRANRLICADSSSGMFVTIFYALLDPLAGTMTYVNAGHNPPLYYKCGKRPGQGYLSQLGRSGIALGVEDETIYEQHTLPFVAGDVLMMYTDGVTDAMDPHGNPYGIERLEGLALNYREASAAEIATALEQSIQSFTAGAPLFDDITTLIVKRL